MSVILLPWHLQFWRALPKNNVDFLVKPRKSGEMEMKLDTKESTEFPSVSDFHQLRSGHLNLAPYEAFLLLIFCKHIHH